MLAPKFLAVALLAAGAAQATTSIPEIDFTDRNVWKTKDSTQTLFAGDPGESLVTLASNVGTINFRQNYDGSKNGVCAGNGGVLACVSDGLGVNDDEISVLGGVVVAEEVTVSFSTAVMLEGLHFLDLFMKGDQKDWESALVFADDSNDPLVFDAEQKRGGFRPGYLFEALATPLRVTSLRFVPGSGNDNSGRPDFALAAIDVAIAPVPLPLGAALMLTAVGGLGLWSRRRAA
jgi:hypothetical protein